MRLIFIRHGDPDYANDNLTEKGRREVKELTKRVCAWNNITEIFCSPLGRAKATAAPSLEKLNRNAVIKDWLQEFPTKHQSADGKIVKTWDIIPEEFCAHPELFHKDDWCNNDYMGKEIPVLYKKVCDGIDEILADYGYVRNKHGFYDVKNPVENRNWKDPIDNYHLTSVKEDYPQEPVLVFFCHLGVMFTIISHLVNVSPVQLWQGFYVAPTSLTILNSEERNKGHAWFRVERLGDTNHLTNGGEPISSSGYFAEVHREKK